MNQPTYSLRGAIVPWKVEEQLRDLIVYCQCNSIDEVMAIVDSEQFTHALPTIEWLDG